jgi:hypothetical protein
VTKSRIAMFSKSRLWFFAMEFKSSDDEEEEVVARSFSLATRCFSPSCFIQHFIIKQCQSLLSNVPLPNNIGLSYSLHLYQA